MSLFLGPVNEVKSKVNAPQCLEFSSYLNSLDPQPAKIEASLRYCGYTNKTSYSCHIQIDKEYGYRKIDESNLSPNICRR